MSLSVLWIECELVLHPGRIAALLEVLVRLGIPRRDALHQADMKHAQQELHSHWVLDGVDHVVLQLLGEAVLHFAGVAHQRNRRIEEVGCVETIVVKLVVGGSTTLFAAMVQLSIAEQWLEREQLVHDAAHAPHVGGGTEVEKLGATKVFERCVQCLALVLSHGHLIEVHDLVEAGEHDVAILSDHHIRRLHIAVNVALAVDIDKGGEQLLHHHIAVRNVQRHLHRQQCGQAGGIVLEDQIDKLAIFVNGFAVVVLAHLQQADNVLVLQRAQQLDLFPNILLDVGPRLRHNQLLQQNMVTAVVAPARKVVVMITQIY